MAPDTLPKAEPRRSPPPSQWRNVYWLTKRIHLKESPSHPEGYYGPGWFKSQRVHPTCDVAEASALESIAKLRKADAPYVIYLGAEPN